MAADAMMSSRDSLVRRSGEGRDAARTDIAPVPTRISYDTLVEACRRLTTDELEVAFKHRYLPVAFAPDPEAYVAAGAAGLAEARAHGRAVAGYAEPGDLVRALETVYGTEICRRAAWHLTAVRPELSALRRLTAAQAAALTIAAGALATAFIVHPTAAAIAASVVFGLVFLAVIGLRLLCLLAPREPPRPPRVSDAELPVYTVLVPLFRETAVLDQLVGALSRLDYPSAKLDIKLILEASDTETRRALEGLQLPGFFEVHVVPEAAPQTKPKALNYGLQFARGDLVAIYDAEDVPERGQLRLAAETFAASPPWLVCLQARLAFYNAGENWLTRHLAAEYAVLYELLLPVLADLGLPLPLGGTSNHFRITALRRLGAWDPHNVTEDADLGLRLARFGWRTAVLASTTGEEAACRWGGWMRQRARWLKGWMQVGLVHSRAPLRTWRQLGPAGSAVALTLTAGMTISALAHPFFLGLFVWSVTAGGLFAPDPDPARAALGGLSLAVLAAGYGISLLAAWAAVQRRYRQPIRRRIAWSLGGIPVYWLAIWVAACMALWQLVKRPYYWNKTDHGLTRWRSPAGFK